MLGGYTKIYALGHIAIKDLFNDPVCVEEKIDGSQFSFGVIDGVLHCRSKNQPLDLDSTENNMFAEAMETAKSLKHLLEPGWVYRGEYLREPKHNTLLYGRIPEKYIIIWDIEKGNGTRNFANYDEKRRISERIGLETVPLLAQDVVVSSFDELNTYLSYQSCLGGVTVEGVVCKNYTRFLSGGHIVAGKYVSETFKEKNTKDWKKRHPSQSDLVTEIIQTYRTEARWDKAIQHSRDKNLLTNTPADIGVLLKALHTDLHEECVEEIKEILWKSFKGNILRGICKGFATYYKDMLVKDVFNNNEEKEHNEQDTIDH